MMTPTKYRLVPCEPTEAMVMAVEHALSRPRLRVSDNRCDQTTTAWIGFANAIAAAPKASEDEELVERVALCLWENTKDDFGEFNGLPGDWKDEARAVLKMLEGE